MVNEINQNGRKYVYANIRHFVYLIYGEKNESRCWCVREHESFHLNTERDIFAMAIKNRVTVYVGWKLYSQLPANAVLIVLWTAAASARALQWNETPSWQKQRGTRDD